MRPAVRWAAALLLAVHSAAASFANEWVVRVPGGAHTALQLAADLGYDFVRPECKVQTKNEKIKKKVELLTQLVNKLLCSQTEAKISVASQEPSQPVESASKSDPTKGACHLKNTLPLTKSALTTFNKDEMCGREFVAVPGKNKTVHCYILPTPTYGQQTRQFDLNLCTHAVFFGYVNSTADFGVVPIERYLPELELFVAACKEKKTIAVLEIGNSAGFVPEKYSKMANDETSRNKFVLSAMEIINKYGLGGLLINWDYPVYWWGHVTRTYIRDKKNFHILMGQLSEKLKEKNCMLITVGATMTDLTTIYDFPKLKGIVDFWLLNNFEFQGSWSTTSAITSSIKNIEQSIKDYGQYIPHEKLVIGVYAFNSPVVLAKESRTGLNSLLSKADMMKEVNIFHSFQSICSQFALGGVKVVHNETGQVNSYAVKNKTWVSYDSSLTINKKVQIIQKNNLGGAYLKNLNDDDFDGKACKCGKFHLLRSINEGLRGDGSCVPQLCP